jgi:hypothetical protein
VRGLDAEQRDRQTVKPSVMSLLGLVRHMAKVDSRFAGLEILALHRTDADPTPTSTARSLITSSSRTRGRRGARRVAFAEQFTHDHDLSFARRDFQDEPISLRGCSCT